MDYVLFGMGFGASLMLLGWALRTFGPQLKYQLPPKEEQSVFLVEQRFWVRFVQGLGGVIAIAGTAMVLLTFVVVLINPGDSLGRNLSLIFWALIVISLLVWCWLYIGRYGLAGIWSRQNGYGFRGYVPTTSLTGSEPPVMSAPRVASTKLVERPTPPVTSEEPEPEIQSTETTLVPVDAEPEPVRETFAGPVYDFGDSSETTVPGESGGRAEALRRLRERQERARQTSNRQQ